jgi:hypothetical protein
MWVFLCFRLRGTFLFKSRNLHQKDIGKEDESITDDLYLTSSVKFQYADEEQTWMDAWSKMVFNARPERVTYSSLLYRCAASCPVAVNDYLHEECNWDQKVPTLPGMVQTIYAQLLEMNSLRPDHFTFALTLMWVYLCFRLQGTFLFKSHIKLQYEDKDKEQTWMDAWANAITSIPLREPIVEGTNILLLR